MENLNVKFETADGSQFNGIVPAFTITKQNGKLVYSFGGMGVSGEKIKRLKVEGMLMVDNQTKPPTTAIPPTQPAEKEQ